MKYLKKYIYIWIRCPGTRIKVKVVNRVQYKSVCNKKKLYIRIKKVLYYKTM